MSGDEGLLRGGQGEDDGFDEGDEETKGLRARRLGIGGRGEVDGAEFDEEVEEAAEHEHDRGWRR